MAMNDGYSPRPRTTAETRWQIRASLAVMSVAIIALAGWLPATGHAGSAAENLYQGLLHSPLENVPAGISVSVADLRLDAQDEASGLVGAVRISFPGGDPRAQINYYVFSDMSSAVAYDNRHLSLPPQIGKLLAYPPMAHCADTANGGYCDMIVEADAVVITTATSAAMDRGSAPMMELAFRHLNHVVSASYQSSAPPKVGGLSACGLADSADVTAAVGAPTGAPQIDRIGGCSWMAARGGVSIQPQEGGRSKFEFDRSRTQAAQSIAGIGDDAFAFQSLAGFVQINLLKGEHYVVIILQGEGTSDAMERATALAAKVAARL